MARYTITTLRNEIETINQSLLDIGSLKRLEISPRNGYQAVDIYSVDTDGNRPNSGVDRNLECGSSRECGESSWSWYYSEANRIEREQLKSRIAELENK